MLDFYSHKQEEDLAYDDVFQVVPVGKGRYEQGKTLSLGIVPTWICYIQTRCASNLRFRPPF